MYFTLLQQHCRAGGWLWKYIFRGLRKCWESWTLCKHQSTIQCSSWDWTIQSDSGDSCWNCRLDINCTKIRGWCAILIFCLILQIWVIMFLKTNCWKMFGDYKRYQCFNVTLSMITFLKMMKCFTVTLENPTGTTFRYSLGLLW